MRSLLYLATLGACAVGHPLVAQSVVFGGQVRPRFEFRDPGPGEDAFISMRVRGQLAASLDRHVRVFVQYQDVRLWGSETSTLGDFSADGFDLHQGYFELTRPADLSLSARVGRQELSLGGERLVGAVGWTQQGRSFDGIRLSGVTGRARVDVFGALLADATAPAHSGDAFLLGAYAQLMNAGPGTLDLYGIWNHLDGLPTNQTTLGVRWWGEREAVRYRVEGSVQTGERDGRDVSAFMLGARLGRTVGRASLTLWYDYLSGNDDPTDPDARVFDTLFATNHKFYGLVDLFLDIPRQTAGRGLQDFAVKGSLQPHADINVGLDLHSFRVARSSGLSTGHLADEADLTAAYRYSANVEFVTGFTHVIAANGFTEIGGLTGNLSWFYLMTDVRF